MKHPERVEDYLEHIAKAIERATEYIERLGGVSAFRLSQRDQDARQIQDHDPEFVKAHPKLPWTDMRDMRNNVIHNYFDVDINIVWGTVKNDLPPLKQQIDQLLRQRREQEPDRSR